MKFRLSLIPVLAVALMPGLSLAQSANAKVAAPATSSTVANVLGGAPVTALPASPASPSPVVTSSVPSSDDSLGSTQLRESAKIKAQIDLEKLRAGLEAAQHDRLIAQKKFSQQLEEADKGPDSKSGAAAPAAAAPVVREVPKPYATSFYNFNGQSFARLVFNGAQFVVSPGTQLPEGARVEAVSSSNVVLRQNGRKVLVPYLGGGVGWSN